MTRDNSGKRGGTGRLPPAVIPADFNYIAAFLTLDCNLGCSYCINRFGELRPARRLMTGEEWARGLNRIVSSTDLPVTLQGGEPTLHPDFYPIVATLRKDLQVDILTNLETDLARFMREIPPGRAKRNAPYASIRVSYHPETMKIEELAAKVLALLNKGYSIGIWGVDHPRYRSEIVKAREYCLPRGIDFRTKEFLGKYAGEMYGKYKYRGACDRQFRKTVECRTTELLIGPGGDIYRCHSDLYEGRASIGHLLDPVFPDLAVFRPCGYFGHCNPCDIKVKTNRFQEFGHTSVEVLFKPGS